MKLCHCGKELPIQRNAPHGGGRRRVHCSPRCTQIATQCRLYGLDPKEYWELQEKGCAVCGDIPKPGKRKLAIDHEHVLGYSDLSPHEKRKYFRGLLCIVCNRFRLAKLDLEMAKKVLRYLEEYEQRK